MWLEIASLCRVKSEKPWQSPSSLGQFFETTAVQSKGSLSLGRFSHTFMLLFLLFLLGIKICFLELTSTPSEKLIPIFRMKRLFLELFKVYVEGYEMKKKIINFCRFYFGIVRLFTKSMFYHVLDKGQNRNNTPLVRYLLNLMML